MKGGAGRPREGSVWIETMKGDLLNMAAVARVHVVKTAAQGKYELRAVLIDRGSATEEMIAEYANEVDARMTLRIIGAKVGLAVQGLRDRSEEDLEA